MAAKSYYHNYFIYVLDLHSNTWHITISKLQLFKIKAGRKSTNVTITHEVYLTSFYNKNFEFEMVTDLTCILMLFIESGMAFNIINSKSRFTKPNG